MPVFTLPDTKNPNRDAKAGQRVRRLHGDAARDFSGTIPPTGANVEGMASIDGRDAGTAIDGTDTATATAADGKTFVAATAPNLTTLINFNGTNGTSPYAGLIGDAAGDLFGTTASGGAYGDGTVFEIVKTGTGYASMPNTLASFNGADGAPNASLIADATGDLFSTKGGGGADDKGTVFEIAKTGGRYASTRTRWRPSTSATGTPPRPA